MEGALSEELERGGRLGTAAKERETGDRGGIYSVGGMSLGSPESLSWRLKRGLRGRRGVSRREMEDAGGWTVEVGLMGESLVGDSDTKKRGTDDRGASSSRGDGMEESRIVVPEDGEGFGGEEKSKSRRRDGRHN